jgi:hypothetical protein
MTKRGQAVAAQSYKHERRTLIAILDYAIREGLIIENVARIALPTRKIPKQKLVIPPKRSFNSLCRTASWPVAVACGCRPLCAPA